MRCGSCGGCLSGPMLETLRCISGLPDAIGEHACEECGHPEMRLLPDGTYHCPGCGSEVLPVGAPSSFPKSDGHGKAFWTGWLDGRFGEGSNFADNPNLAKWESPTDKLDYYRGHRAGSEARWTNSGPVPDHRGEVLRREGAR